MRAKTGRGVGGAYRIPLPALRGRGIVQRRAEASTRLGERANAVDERRDGSSLSPCLMPSAKTYFAAIDANRRHRLGVVRALRGENKFSFEILLFLLEKILINSSEYCQFFMNIFPFSKYYYFFMNS